MNKFQNLPPGSQIKNIKVTENGKITFSDKHELTPLQPLVESFLDEDKQLQINAIVFIDAQFPQPTFDVYQLFCISSSGNPKLQFFIDYNLKETNATYYNAYQISFNSLNTGFPDGTTLADVELTQSFLWDTVSSTISETIGPITSRGTVSMVQHTY